MKDAHSEKIGQIWADHLVERVGQEESKRRGGPGHAFTQNLTAPAGAKKIDRCAVLGDKLE